MQRSGFCAPEVERVFEKRDEDNVGRYGFSREQFGISMVETYQHLFRTAGRELKGIQENEILSIANRVFSRPAKRTPVCGIRIAILAELPPGLIDQRR